VSLLTAIEKKNTPDDPATTDVDESAIEDSTTVGPNKCEATARRLQDIDTGVATYKWGCDDTGFECSPVCLKSVGVTMTNVASSKCAGVAPDPCGCKCYFNTAWTCEGDSVVCSATDSRTLKTKTVGAKVCSSRGVERPALSDFTQRVADKCERKPVASRMPTDQCMQQAVKARQEREAGKLAAEQAAAEAAAAAAAAEASTAAPETLPEVEEDLKDLNIESFATAATLAAVTMLA